MKNQNKLACREARKLNLNKRTVSNLGVPEMTKVVGGGPTFRCWTDFRCTQGCGTNNCAPTQRGHTCNGGNNCV